jgi:hypothetical protein
MSLSSASARTGPLVSFILLVLLPCTTFAQSPDGGPVSVLGSDALQIGGLIQTDAYLGREIGDGFRARSARVRLGGRAESLSYVVQTELTSPEVLLDAVTRLSLTDRVQLSAGLFKTPYSGEILTPRPNLLFAERARVVNNLAPARQVGATLSGDLIPDRLTATVGAFNGTSGLQANDNDHLLYVGRLASTTPTGAGPLSLGVNAGYSIDDQVQAPRPVSFSGRRFLIGGDAQLDADQWLLAGEVHYAALDPDDPTRDAYAPFGYYVAGGIDVAPSHQLLARIDRYDPDVPGLTSPDHQVTLGYNFFATSAVRALINYQAPTTDLADGFITLRLQAALQ